MLHLAQELNLGLGGNMRVIGDAHARRHFFRLASRRWRLLTAVAATLALVAGLIIGIQVHFARWGPPPASDPGRPVAVHPVQGRKVYIPPMRPYRRPPVSWPAAASATVTVAGAMVRAGDTPVLVGPASGSPRAAAAVPSQVEVQVAPHQAAAALGLHGVVFTVIPAAGSAGGRVHVSVDYSRFAHAYGGDYAGRLHLVELPACALTTPQLASCRVQVPVRSAAGNDVRTQLAGGDVTLPGTAVSSSDTVLLADTTPPAVVLAATAGPSGDGGNFTQPPFSEANEWVSGASSGAYSYSYPVQVPPVPGGFAPTVKLQYSSQLTDGLTSATNTQASWIGDGWDYQPGYIEQDYPQCSRDPALSHAGDWCTSLPADAGATPALTLSLNGTQTPIVGGITGRAEADGGATYSYGPGGSVVMTQRDGTTYYFGLNQLTGWAAGDVATNSQWTLPAWNPSTSSYQNVAWRLVLDYKTDRHGNAIAFFYNQQQNWYKQSGLGAGTGQYVRAGTLAKITYGFQDGHAYDQVPPGEVDFTTAGGRQDAPTDLTCTQNPVCNVGSPTFWNDQQLTGISAKALVNGSQRSVDSWSLSQVFPATGDPLTAPSLWLSSVTQTGQDGTTPITLPPTSFAGTPMPNRVMTSADTTAGYSPITRFRITSVTNATGGVTTIKYTPHDSACTAGAYPTGDTNTAACYPNSWSPPSGGSPVPDWWNLYAVASKTVTDTTGGDPPVVTSYTYAGPGWHYDNDTVSRSATETFDGWRGFRTITTETGTAPDPVTERADTYFQGMSKDCAASSCPHGTPVTLTSSRGSTADDSNGKAGMTFEEITYNGAGTGNEVTDTIHDAGIIATTATGAGDWNGVTASIVRDNAVATYTTLTGGGVREAVTNYTYDRNGLVTEEYDQPDLNDPSQWTCTTKAYGTFDLVTEEDTYSYLKINSTEVCATLASTATVAQMQSAAVSATASSYDPAGNLTQEQRGTGIIAAGTGTCPADTPSDPHVACWTWQTTQTGTYDSYGRPLTSTDADNRATTTAYTPSAGAEPATVTVTDPMGLVTTTTYDPARDLPLTVTDPAGYQTVKAYDALGRVTSQWTPGNPASGQAVGTYSYAISSTAPSYSTEQAETPGGGYLTTVTINDSLGQVREVQQQTAGSGSDVTDTAYNSDGWKAVTSSPYYSSAAPSGTLVAAGSVPSQTGYVYDGAGRVIRQVAYKNGTETWETDTTYGGSYTTVVPPSGGTAQTSFTDARGLTTAIYQYHAGAPADPSDPAADYDKTSYTYTAAKKLASITDAAGNSWSNTYDMLGNQLSRATPDSGTTTSAYDAAGQVMTVTDARGSTTSWAYDADGRKTAEYDTTGGALESSADEIASWTYDTLAKGKLSSSTSYVNGAQYTDAVTGYGSQGQPSGIATVIPSAQGALAGTYTQTYTYAPGGQETSYTDSAAGGLPAETVTTGYDSAGEPDSLVGTTAYVTGLTYTTLGQPLQYTMGTSSQPAWITDTWDPQTGALTEQDTQAGTGQASIDDLHYSYDNSGNITSEADTPTGATGAADVQCFQNDYLGRLVQAWAQAAGSCATTPSASAEGGAAPYWNSYSYDTAGNLTSTVSTTPAGAVTTTTGTYPAPGSAQPHAVTTEKTTTSTGTTTSSYSYDKAGHLLTVTGGQGPAYTWNGPGQLTQDAVTPAGGGTAQDTSYIYDAAGTLLLETGPGTTTLYLGDEELSLTGGTVTGTRYYTLAGIPVATRTGASSVAYLAGDSQDTSTAAIDAATGNITRRWYDPYGNPRGTAPASFPAGHKGFVGGTTSTATGLTNLGAREYQPALGTFLTTDPILKPYEPTDLNPYSYAQGNPSTYSDPSGLTRPGNDSCGSGGCQSCNTSTGANCAYRNTTYGCYSDDSTTFQNCLAAHNKARGAQPANDPCHYSYKLLQGICEWDYRHQDPGLLRNIAGAIKTGISWAASRVKHSLRASVAGVAAAAAYLVGLAEAGAATTTLVGEKYIESLVETGALSEKAGEDDINLLKSAERIISGHLASAVAVGILACVIFC